MSERTRQIRNVTALVLLWVACLVPLVAHATGDSLVLEDAEDGDTALWQTISAVCSPSIGVQNVSSGDAHGRVLQFCSYSSGDALHKLFPATPGAWGGTAYDTLSWEMRGSRDVMFLVNVQTNQGEKTLRYYGIPHRVQEEQWVMDVGAQANDGQWHTYTRDLVSDVGRVYGSGVQYLGTSSIAFRGPGFSLDNITLTSGAGRLPRLAGAVRDRQGVPVTGVAVRLSLNSTTLTDYTEADGSFSFSSLGSGAYTLEASPSSGMMFGSVQGIIPSGDVLVEKELRPAIVSTLTVEDAEHGTTSGWKNVSGSLSGSGMSNVAGPSGRAIHLNGNGTSYRYDFTGRAGTPFGSADHPFIRWSMKPFSPFIFYVLVSTNQGPAAIRYTGRMPYTAAQAQQFIHLGDHAMDGQWHAYDRDLQSDLIVLYGDGIAFRGVTGLIIRGGMELDSVVLGESGTEGLTFGEATDTAGNTVPGALAVLTNAESGLRFTAFANPSGFYAFTSLPSGTYTLSLTASGHTFASQAIEIDDPGSDGQLTESQKARIRAACDYSGSPVSVDDHYEDTHIHVEIDDDPADVMEALREAGITAAFMSVGHIGDGSEPGVIENSRRLDGLFLQAARECSRIRWSVAVYPDEGGQAAYLDQLDVAYPGLIHGVSMDIQHSNRPIANNITSAEMTNVLNAARDHGWIVDAQINIRAALDQDPESTIEDDFYSRLLQYPTVSFLTFAFDGVGVQDLDRFLETPNLLFNAHVGHSPDLPYTYEEVEEYVATVPEARVYLPLHRTTLGTDSAVHGGDGGGGIGLRIGDAASNARAAAANVSFMETNAIDALRGDLQQTYAAEGRTQEEIDALLASDARLTPALGFRMRQGLTRVLDGG